MVIPKSIEEIRVFITLECHEDSHVKDGVDIHSLICLTSMAELGNFNILHISEIIAKTIRVCTERSYPDEI
jgi:hypothetical protein